MIISYPAGRHIRNTTRLDKIFKSNTCLQRQRHIHPQLVAHPKLACTYTLPYFSASCTYEICIVSSQTHLLLVRLVPTRRRHHEPAPSSRPRAYCATSPCASTFLAAGRGSIFLSRSWKLARISGVTAARFYHKHPLPSSPNARLARTYLLELGNDPLELLNARLFHLRCRKRSRSVLLLVSPAFGLN